jgi:hypothetical protein
MKRYNHIYIIDASYHDKGARYLGRTEVHESFEKFLRFIQRHNQYRTMENTVIVYANNWQKTQEDIDMIKREVNIYNKQMFDDQCLKFETAYTSEDVRKLYKYYPARRTYICGGNLTGCLVDESLPINYHILKRYDKSTKIVPELGYDTARSIYDVWKHYQRDNIQIETLQTLEQYLFEQSTRNNGFLFTREENDYEIPIINKDLFLKRNRRNNT